MADYEYPYVDVSSLQHGDTVFYNAVNHRWQTGSPGPALAKIADIVETEDDLPAGPPASPDDLIIVNDTGDGYVWVEGEWKSVGSVRGLAPVGIDTPSGVASLSKVTFSTPIEGRFLRRWRSKIAAATPAAPAILAMIGDSVTEGAYGAPAEKFRLMNSRHNNGNLPDLTGWVPGAHDTYPLRPLRMRMTVGAAGTVGNANGRVEGAGLDNYAIRLAAGAEATLSKITAISPLTYGSAKVTFSQLRFFYSKRPGGGTLRFWASPDNVSWTEFASVSTDGAASSGNSITYGDNIVKYDAYIKVTCTGAAAIYDGVYISNGDKVWIFNGAHAGQNHTHYNVPALIGFLQNLAPDLVTDAHGINDYGSTDPITFAGRMKSYRDAVVAATNADFVFVTPYGTAGRANWPEYVYQAKKLALDEDVALIDMHGALGLQTDNPWGLVSDGVHLSAAGGTLYATVLASALDENHDVGAYLPLGGGIVQGELYIQNYVSAILQSIGRGGGLLAPGWSVRYGENKVPHVSVGALDLVGRPFIGMTSDPVTGSDLDFAIITTARGVATMFSYGAPTVNGATAILYGQAGRSLQQAAKTGTTYTIVAADGTNTVECSNASGCTVTVPPNATIAFPIGTEIVLRQIGTGQITMVGGAGVTINSRVGLKTAGQWAEIKLKKRATDTWILTGDTAA